MQKMSKATSPIVDLYEMRGPSTSRRHSAVYLHPDRARYNYFNAAASSSRDYNAVEVSVSFYLLPSTVVHQISLSSNHCIILCVASIKSILMVWYYNIGLLYNVQSFFFFYFDDCFYLY